MNKGPVAGAKGVTVARKGNLAEQFTDAYFTEWPQE